MQRVPWSLRCAAVAALVVLTTLGARGENDPLGLEATPAVQQRTLDDALRIIEEGPGAERSLLAAEPVVEAEASQRDFCRCVGEAESPSLERIEEALRIPLNSSGLDFSEVPLVEVVNLLQEDYGIPIQLDVHALAENGLAPEEPVTTKLHNISLRSALRLMLGQLRLTYVVRDEVLMITTTERAEQDLVTCVYDVRDLVDGGAKPVDALIDTIISCVSLETWKENGGGEAEIRPLEPGLLVISQTHAVHEAIGSLLSAARELRGERPDAAGGHEDAVEKVATRSYMLQVPVTGEQEKVLEQVSSLIVRALPDEQWEGQLADGQSVVFSVLPDRIVLRHWPATHDRVEKLLRDSGVAIPLSEMPERGGGGFGGGGGVSRSDQQNQGGGFFRVDDKRR